LTGGLGGALAFAGLEALVEELLLEGALGGVHDGVEGAGTASTDGVVHEGEGNLVAVEENRVVVVGPGEADERHGVEGGRRVGLEASPAVELFEVVVDAEVAVRLGVEAAAGAVDFDKAAAVVGGRRGGEVGGIEHGSSGVRDFGRASSQ
jgi:hypothetical protein